MGVAKEVYSPPQVDRIWGIIWGSFYNIPKAIFYLLKGDYIPAKHSPELRTPASLPNCENGSALA